MARSFDPLVIADIRKSEELISEIETRGFKRSSSNKNHFLALAESPEKYITKVKRVLDEHRNNEYVGYYYETLDEAFHAAIPVVMNPDFSNYNKVKEFFTAATITGYAYNNMPNMVNGMRPVDDYDIIRYFLMFWTIKEFGINEPIRTVQKHKKNYITLGDVKIFIPKVNGFTLPLDMVKERFESIPEFPQITDGKLGE